MIEAILALLWFSLIITGIIFVIITPPLLLIAAISWVTTQSNDQEGK